MGQITLPVLNRKGYSSLWENLWYDKKSYSQIFSEDIFLEKYVITMLNTFNSSSSNLFSNIILLEKQKYKNVPFLENQDRFSKKTLIDLQAARMRKIPLYFSRIFIIRYNSWIILYTYVYVPKVWKIRLKKNKVRVRYSKNLLDLYTHKTKILNMQFYRL